MRSVLPFLALPLLAVSPCNAQPREIHYTTPAMARVVIDSNRPYRRATVTGVGDVELTLDVYHATTRPDSGLPPLLVFVHGGLVEGTRPLAKDWPSYRSWGRAAAANGMTGVVLNHRMNTSDNADSAASDLVEALKHLRTNAAALGVDANRICVAFYSAGGPMASVLLRGQQAGIRCVLLFYPFLDVEHLRSPTAFRPAASAARLRAMAFWSPRFYLSRGPAGLPPIFLARAGRDAIPRLNASIDRFVDVALASNVQLDLYTHPTGEHGFDVVNRDDRTREIIVQALRFAQRHLGMAVQAH